MYRYGERETDDGDIQQVRGDILESALASGIWDVIKRSRRFCFFLSNSRIYTCHQSHSRSFFFPGQGDTPRGDVEASSRGHVDVGAGAGILRSQDGGGQERAGVLYGV